MRRISSKRTFFLKRVFPIAWFGFLAVFAAISLGAKWGGARIDPTILLIPAFMAVVGFILMKVLAFDLADEVWDDTDVLVVKNKGWEERIPLANIINVSSSTATNPQRITLTLREPCRFGKEVTFSPPTGFLRFSRSKIASELIVRIDEKRRR